MLSKTDFDYSQVKIIEKGSEVRNQSHEVKQ
jgi:hypothetical protein